MKVIVGNEQEISRLIAEEFIKQVNSLNPDDADFAAKYQAITGEALSVEGIEELSQGV